MKPLRSIGVPSIFLLPAWFCFACSIIVAPDRDAVDGEAGSSNDSEGGNAGSKSEGGGGGESGSGDSGAAVAGEPAEGDSPASDGGRASRGATGGVGGYVSIDSTACEEADDYAADCGLLETGSLCRQVPRDTDVCLAECMSVADCDAFVEVRCAFDPDNPVSGPFEDPDENFSEAGASLAKCMNRCAFTCEGATGEVSLATKYRCDDLEDCSDGADERGCPDNSFECDDGQVIAGSWVCDGQDDCADAEEEQDCDNQVELALSCE